ncbi:signal peptidase I [Streptomyces albipurpureus]|uniref:Signal peptidase I n=1 Tax=Streptomyces albipurpureus TaxID=2897419 RepID=A0ABT0UXJ1_9ACTN|nr:signal peptidase I [Streptomyces sp. CWNU-1]MCM2392961.1 signal peptidase I [Streptomyces sp. CWNU-1]
MDTEAKYSERDPATDPHPGESAEGSRSADSRGDTGTEATTESIWARLGIGSWRGMAVLGVTVITVVLLFSHFVIQPFQIPSGSMAPALHSGDRVLVNKLAYRFGAEPERGDVIVFDGRGSFVREGLEENPVSAAARGVLTATGLMDPDDTDFVKRVVGVGGDRVVCCDKGGGIQVNGVAVDEGYLYPGDKASEVAFDIVVPDGTLWVMGDHRSDSRDSRDHLGQPGGGMVPVEKVVGRADWIAWPVSRLTSLEKTDAFARVPDASARPSHGRMSGRSAPPAGVPMGSSAPGGIDG